MTEMSHNNTMQHCFTDVLVCDCVKLWQSSVVAADSVTVCSWVAADCHYKHCVDCRFYKLHTKGLCEVIPMTVPRKVVMTCLSLIFYTILCNALLYATLRYKFLKSPKRKLPRPRG